MYKLCVRADCFNHLIHSYALVPSDRLNSVLVTGCYLVHYVYLRGIITYKCRNNIKLFFKSCANFINRYAVNVPVCISYHRQKISTSVFYARACLPIHTMRSYIYIVIHTPVYKVGVTLCRPVVLLKFARFYRSDQSIDTKLFKTVKPLFSVKARGIFIKMSAFKGAVPYHRTPIKFASCHFCIDFRALNRISIFVGHIYRHIVLTILFDSLKRLFAPEGVLFHSLIRRGNFRNLQPLGQICVQVKLYIGYLYLLKRKVLSEV